MAKLSVVIVNYNVKYFLEQVLLSCRKAVKGVDAEIFVVDNNSTDGSVQMVQNKFPEVKIIANKENVGFSKANNQAIEVSTGEYVLLLNPDTVVEEDTFKKVIHFMDEHPEAGGLGVKMLDGKGNFLPESKRGFPTPKVSFFKAFGFTSLFPKSKLFAQYYLGHLDENEIQEVEVLAGAFMLLRKKVLDEIGLLDETFFMYGEDIDLSYRIIEAGYKNYYYPHTRIIHYKGESTKKGSLNYVKMFYQAMIIFAQKHFSSRRASYYTTFIRAAIYFRAAITVVVNFFRFIMPLLLDALFIFLGIFIIKEFWANNIKDAAEYYPQVFMQLIVPIYILIWILTIYFSGGYDKPYKVTKAVRGILIGTLIILALYGLLDENYRFSRAIIILGAGWAALAAVLLRVTYNFINYKEIFFDIPKDKNLIIVGSYDEGNRALTLLKQTGIESNFIGFVAPAHIKNGHNYLGDSDELDDITSVYQADEIIFCSKDLPAQEIIHWMTRIGNKVDYKIIPEDSLSIIGSNSKDTAGDLYAIDVNLAIASPMQKRNKRVLDILISLALLISLPFSIFIVKDIAGFIQNIFKVIFGNKTWVSYSNNPVDNSHLPKIRKGILSPKDAIKKIQVNEATIERLNLLYAKDYSPYKDLEIIWKGFKYLGRS